VIKQEMNIHPEGILKISPFNPFFIKYSYKFKS